MTVILQERFEDEVLLSVLTPEVESHLTIDLDDYGITWSQLRDYTELQVKRFVEEAIYDQTGKTVSFRNIEVIDYKCLTWALRT